MIILKNKTYERLMNLVTSSQDIAEKMVVNYNLQQIITDHYKELLSSKSEKYKDLLADSLYRIKETEMQQIAVLSYRKDVEEISIAYKKLQIAYKKLKKKYP